MKKAQLNKCRQMKSRIQVYLFIVPLNRSHVHVHHISFDTAHVLSGFNQNVTVVTPSV